VVEVPWGCLLLSKLRVLLLLNLLLPQVLLLLLLPLLLLLLVEVVVGLRATRWLQLLQEVQQRAAAVRPPGVQLGP
jgi:hypothetical protein